MSVDRGGCCPGSVRPSGTGRAASPGGGAGRAAARSSWNGATVTVVSGTVTASGRSDGQDPDAQGQFAGAHAGERGGASRIVTVSDVPG